MTLPEDIFSITEVFAGVYLKHPKDLPLYRGSTKSTGVDIRAAGNVTLYQLTPALVRTDCSIYTVENDLHGTFDLQVRPRSGLASKGILAHFGSVDVDFEDPITVLLFNLRPEPYNIRRGDRIAQLVLAGRPFGPLVRTEFVRNGGLGSTGLS